MDNLTPDDQNFPRYWAGGPPRIIPSAYERERDTRKAWQIYAILVTLAFLGLSLHSCSMLNKLNRCRGFYSERAD